MASYKFRSALSSSLFSHRFPLLPKFGQK